MIYLAVISCAGALFAHSMAEMWSQSLKRILTVQIPDPTKSVNAQSDVTNLERIVQLLRVTPGAQQITAFDEKKILNLLYPWLGSDLIKNIPLPAMIDVHFLSLDRINLKDLRSRLAQAVPGTIAEDHGLTIGKVKSITLVVQIVAWAVFSLVGIISLLSIFFTVISGLSVNIDILQLLSLMGAGDSFIAVRFQKYIMKSAMLGCILGGISAVGSILAMVVLIKSSFNHLNTIDMEFVNRSYFSVVDWSIICSVPIIFGLASIVAARIFSLIIIKRLT